MMLLKTTLVATTLLSTTAFAQSNYDLAKLFLKTVKTDNQAVANVLATAPTTYNFDNRFGAGSSVSYTGQSFRQVLLNDIKGAMSSQLRNSQAYTKAEIVNMLNSYYKYNENNTNDGPIIDGFVDFGVKANIYGGVDPQTGKAIIKKNVPVSEGFIYADIQSPGKNLYKKIAGVDNPLRRGQLYGTNVALTPDAYVSALFEEFAENTVNGKNFSVPNGTLAPQTINGAYVTEDGRDLAQLVQKFLTGAVSYSQSARDYLSTDLGAKKGLNADNTKEAKPDAGYTAMEHHFDEAFGYFGGARNFGEMPDNIIASSLSIDANKDGAIAIKSELNLGLAKNFGRVDLLAADQDLDLTKEVMDAFIQGRHLIANAPQGYEKYVEALSAVALGAWEKTLATVTVIYINFTLKEYSEYGTSDYLFKNFAKYWSEMKGFAFAFQFNPRGIMTDADFDRLHALMGEAPVLPHASKANVDIYKQKLIDARDLLGSTYGFSANNLANW
jgi:hypothetical protein